MGPAHDRHHGRLTGHAQARQLPAGGRRTGGQGHLDEVGTRRLELQDTDQRPHRHRLFDEGGQQVRGRHRYVDAPGLVEQPVVLGVVHPGHHPGDGELLFSQQRHHKVVLVVTGGGHDHVGGGQAGGVQRRDLAGVPHHPLDAQARSSPGHVRVYLHQEHLVAGVVQVGGQISCPRCRPRRSRPSRHHDLHGREPFSRPISSSSSALSSTAMCRTSPSWPISPGLGTTDLPARDRATIRTRPVDSSSSRR